MEQEKLFICCICNSLNAGFGNNPEGAAWQTEDGKIEMPEFSNHDRCCNACNSSYVIPGRLYRIRLAEQNKQNKTDNRGE